MAADRAMSKTRPHILEGHWPQSSLKLFYDDKQAMTTVIRTGKNGQRSWSSRPPIFRTHMKEGQPLFGQRVDTLLLMTRVPRNKFELGNHAFFLFRKSNDSISNLGNAHGS